jgi:hypothetical protein
VRFKPDAVRQKEGPLARAFDIECGLNFSLSD